MSPASVAPERARILLVEDDPAVRRSLQLMLHARGFDVRAYATGEALLGDPKVTDAACVVADYRMAGIDGVMVLERLREQGWHKPAILITAYPTTEILSQARGAGFATVIEKPLRHNALADAVDRLLAA